MHSEMNPYAPGSGLRPPAMAGRGSEIDDFDLLVARSKRGFHNRGMVLTGLRGVGKTVLLNFLRNHAESQGWLAIGFEAKSGEKGSAATRERLARSMLQASRKFVRGSKASGIKEAMKSISSFSATVGVSGISFGFEAKPGRADSGSVDVDFEEMIEDLSTALSVERRALGIFIDEMQDVDEDLLAALVSAQHRAGQEGWPFYVIGAGLPNLPAILSDARSYAERLFDYRQIGPLQPDEAARALVEPAVKYGARFDEPALNALVSESGGYPYFIQEFGKAIWDIASTSQFSMDDALLAIDAGWRQLDSGFFPARWARATKAERNYLSAMAGVGDIPVSTRILADRLESTQQALSPTRAGLIEKGLIFAPEHGMVSFTVPGMAGYIERQRIDLNE